MQEQKIDNKRIAKNTIYLYIQMIVVMVVGLYTVRAVLNILGVIDYGIYNVVGGVVAMFSFVNSTLASASQRYFSIELAKGDFKRLNEWFCLNISSFSIFIILFLIVAETIGLWFLNTQMIIPEDRGFAANVVYQLSILSFCISFLSIPYNALIIAHEKMSVFAYISIIEALLKLTIVLGLEYLPGDKLIIYGILMLLTSTCITMSYVVYNLMYFKESRFKFYWNTRELKELIGFSSWHLMGTFANVIRSQGINILLNMFFNPTINAARAIAFQIYNAVSQLSSNFFMAVKPQIYKSYANKDYDGLFTLINRSTTICSYLISILVFPILANTDYILELWLKNIPDYAIVFTQLVLINGVIDSTNGPTIASALATGKIRNYQITIAVVTFMNLPFSYVLLKLGCEPTITMVLSIIISFIIVFLRAYLLKSMINLPFRSYSFLIIRISLVSIGLWVGFNYFFYGLATTFLQFIGVSCIIEIILLLCYMVFVFSHNDMKTMTTLVLTYLRTRWRN